MRARVCLDLIHHSIFFLAALCIKNSPSLSQNSVLSAECDRAMGDALYRLRLERQSRTQTMSQNAQQAKSSANLILMTYGLLLR